MQPQIVSRQVLTPFLTTPNHPRTHHLSYFDQTAPRFYGPLVYFYTHKTGIGIDDVAQKSSLLRTSLSKILSHYYPLAGKIRNDEASVDCSDGEVVFVEARIGLRLSELLKNTRAEIVDVLFPDGLQYKDANLSTLLAVQVTFFECGGMAIAICIPHKVMDMASMCSFVFDWANMTREGKEFLVDFNIGTLYPRLNVPTYVPNRNKKMVPIVSKRLVFNNTNICKLKSLAAEETKSPTKVEVVTAMISKTIMAAVRGGSKIPKKLALCQAINLRRRSTPPLTEKNVGNFMDGYFVVIPEEDNDKVDLKWLVRELRREKLEYLAFCKRASSGKELCLMIKEHKKKAAEFFDGKSFEMVVSTSWCRFPYYAADFGWGKPAWVTTATYIAKNMIMMMDTRDGDGIEAIVTLEEPDMTLFERDEELLAFASFNPSRLDNYHGTQTKSKL